MKPLESLDPSESLEHLEPLSEQSNVEEDLKKQPIHKIRKIILEQNTTFSQEEIAKMKKPELLKLLKKN